MLGKMVTDNLVLLHKDKYELTPKEEKKIIDYRNRPSKKGQLNQEQLFPRLTKKKHLLKGEDSDDEEKKKSYPQIAQAARRSRRLNKILISQEAKDAFNIVEDAIPAIVTTNDTGCLPKNIKGNVKKQVKKNHQLQKVKVIKAKNSVKEKVEQAENKAYKKNRTLKSEGLPSKTRALTKAKQLEQMKFEQLAKLAQGYRSRQINRQPVNLAEYSSEEDEQDREEGSIMESTSITQTETEFDEEKEEEKVAK